MTTTTKMMKISVEFEVHCTMSWMGKRDENGEIMNEASYKAIAYILGSRVASSDPGVWYKTENAAIRAAAEAVREIAN